MGMAATLLLNRCEPFEQIHSISSTEVHIWNLANSGQGTRRDSTIGFHLLWHTVELVMSTRLCLL